MIVWVSIVYQSGKQRRVEHMLEKHLCMRAKYERCLLSAIDSTTIGDNSCNAPLALNAELEENK